MCKRSKFEWLLFILLKVKIFFLISSAQIESLKKELEHSGDSYQKMKRTYEEQLNNYLIKEKVTILTIINSFSPILLLVVFLNVVKNFMCFFLVIFYQELIDVNDRLLKEKDDEIYDLKSQLNDAKNSKLNNQQLHDALIHDFKKTISVLFIFFYLLVYLSR